VCFYLLNVNLKPKSKFHDLYASEIRPVFGNCVNIKLKTKRRQFTFPRNTDTPKKVIEYDYLIECCI